MAKHLFTFLAFFSCILLSVSSITVDLFHRDSPRSPFHNRSLSEYDRVNNAVARSINHKLGPTNGDQLMQISVGTPPKPFTVIVNTKENFTWINCEPCKECYKQRDPLFNPSQSSTYKTIACSTNTCADLYMGGCDVSRSTCTFHINYSPDGSGTFGDVATDTLTIGSATHANMLFGCGTHNFNNGYFGDADGVAGLGPGSNIFDKVNGPHNRDLSYCVASAGATGKIRFGTSVYDAKAVTTQLHTSAGDVSYRVTLESVKIHDVTISYPKKSSPHGATLDTTSIVTKLPTVFFDQLKRELVKAINGTPRQDPSGVYPLCYGVQDNVKLPTLTAQFSGAELQIPPSNTFVQISPDLICLTIFPSDDGSTHFGYLFQTNFLIGFDSRKGQVSFKPTDCGKL